MRHMVWTGVLLELAERGAKVPQDLSYEELQGILLKQVRLVKHMSQERLAEKSGVSTPTIIHLERGKHKAQRSTLKALAAALGWPEDDLDPRWAFFERPEDRWFQTGLRLDILDRGVERARDLSNEELFGMLLKRLRKFRGMSMGELAKLSKVSKQAINDLEAGRHTPPKTVEKLAKSLGIAEWQLATDGFRVTLEDESRSFAKQIRESDKQGREQREKETA